MYSNDSLGIVMWDHRPAGRFAPHGKICDILRAAIKSQFSANMLSLCMWYSVNIYLTYRLLHTCNFFQMLMQINRSNWGHLQNGALCPMLLYTHMHTHTALNLISIIYFYIYIHTYITYIHACTYIRKLACMHARMHIHTYKHTYIQTFIHRAFIHTYIHRDYIHTIIHMRRDKRKNTYTHVHARTRTHTHTHAHPHARMHARIISISFDWPPTLLTSSSGC